MLAYLAPALALAVVACYVGALLTLAYGDSPTMPEPYAGETNNLHATLGPADIERFRSARRTVDWNDRQLKRIVRLRLLSDNGFPWWDVSYCWGELKDGTPVHVDLPDSQLPRGRTAQGGSKLHLTLFAWARRDGVYLKGLGLFEPGVISTLT